MASFLNIGVSGLLASQRQLTTTGHNISNANTPGFSRQRVELTARPPQGAGGVFFGSGVQVATVQRQVSSFLESQVLTARSNLAGAESLNELVRQVNNLLADADAGLTPAIQGFFNGVQSVADDPASVPARQVLLSEAETLVNRFNETHTRLREMNDSVNARLGETVDDINSLTSRIADINRQIVQAIGRGQGNPPNDLLDQRDVMLDELSGLAEVQFVAQDDGAVNVLLGKGQVLVAGGLSQELALVNHPLDATRKEVAHTGGGSGSIVSQDISRGRLGGVLQFRDTVLDPARNAVGRAAAAMAEQFNLQHREGMDATGSLGGDFFTGPAPVVTPLGTNTGTVSVSYSAGGAAAGLNTSNYELTHDGTDFTLRRLSDGTAQTLSGAGPFTVDGLVFTVGTPPAAGDRYMVLPTREAASRLRLAVGSTSEIAAAAPTRTLAVAANRGDAEISAGEIIDAGDANLLTTATLVFQDPPTSFQVNGAGPLLPYTSGADIDVNGTRFQINGAPQAGDTFRLEANTGGIGDNRNALLLAGLQTARLLENGSASIESAYAQLVTEVGTATRQAESSVTALQAIQGQAVSARDSMSGVNLEEEAANLLRFQQQFQAAAQVIVAAQTTFDALLGAVRG